ncbi:MAG: DUF1460 domain-containing protein [Gemmatimonadetes bacterium]|nr:DUF1460 domain-containing protein [Gemmatimonadota bacterium]
MVTRAKTVRTMPRWLAVLGVCVLGACGGDPDGSSGSALSGGPAQLAGAGPSGRTGGDTGTTDAPAGANTGTADAQVGPTTLPGTDADWAIVQEKARWAVEQGYSGLSIGDLVVRIGETFVGTPYAPHTLETPGEETLVIELEELDCVTFVENVLALARLVQTVPDELLVARSGRRQRPLFSSLLEDIRYRGGVLEQYPSRLHYFSEWISDNAEMGLVRDVSQELGGVPDDEPIDFMTTHPDAYRQLREDPAFLDELKEVEARLSAEPRYYIPEDRIAMIEDGIQDGDIIAATSTVAGLDIAHTGIALWRDGRLHLLHAPLAGGVVQISEMPLAERIQRIGGQDGVMVARPLEAR